MLINQFLITVEICPQITNCAYKSVFNYIWKYDHNSNHTAVPKYMPDGIARGPWLAPGLSLAQLLGCHLPGTLSDGSSRPGPAPNVRIQILNSWNTELPKYWNGIPCTCSMVTVSLSWGFLVTTIWKGCFTDTYRLHSAVWQEGMGMGMGNVH